MKIVITGNPVLRQKAQKLVGIDKELLKQTEEVAQTLAAEENGAGLAAPQVGISKRFFAIKDTKTKQIAVFINPEIKKTYGERSYLVTENEKGEREPFLEGCLSVPAVFGTVRRYLKVEVSWQEVREGRLKKMRGVREGFEAIVFQHELDHLNGILFTDRVMEEGGKLYRQEGEKMVEIERVLKSKV